MALRKPPIIATVLTIMGIAVLCTLGTWQLQRLEWKEGLLARIALETSYETVIPASDIETLAYSSDKNLYKRGTIYGRFTGQTRYLMPRTHEGKSGKNVIAPFITDNNQFIIVDLGWLPFDHEGINKFDLNRTALQGVLRRPDGKNWLTPANDDASGIWYAIDFDDLGQGFVPQGYNVMPAVFYSEGDLPFAHDGLIAHTAGWQPPNNHLSYAFFWFIMAGVLAVIFALRFVKEPTPKAQDND